MKQLRLPFFISVFTVFVFCSCNKHLDPDLGEFQGMEIFINASQNNQYEASLLCKKWSRTKVVFEVFLDGNRVSSTDVTHEWGNTEVVLRSDNTMTLGSADGRWLYSHNYLFWTIGMWVQEVIKLDKQSLQLRWEEFLSEPITPYSIDSSGEHRFYIFEYTSK